MIDSYKRLEWKTNLSIIIHVWDIYMSGVDIDSNVFPTAERQTFDCERVCVHILEILQHFMPIMSSV